MPDRKMDSLSRYRQGWVAGAGWHPACDGTMPEEYMWGWRDGRAAFYDAMTTARVRLEMPPAVEVYNA